MTYSFRFVPFRLRVHSLLSMRGRVAEGRSRFVLARICPYSSSGLRRIWYSTTALRSNNNGPH